MWRQVGLILLFLAISLVPGVSISDNKSTIPLPQVTEANMREYMQSHIDRVVKLVERIFDFQGLPSGYRSLDKKLAVEFAKVHDRNKISGYASTGESYASVLARSFGKDAYQRNKNSDRLMTPDEAAEFIARKDELNEDDRKVEDDFLREHGLLNPDGSRTKVAELLMRLVKIADIIDRGMNPDADIEFGGKLKNPTELVRDLTQKLVTQESKSSKDIAAVNAWIIDYQIIDWLQKEYPQLFGTDKSSFRDGVFVSHTNEEGTVMGCQGLFM